MLKESRSLKRCIYSKRMWHSWSYYSVNKLTLPILTRNQRPPIWTYYQRAHKGAHEVHSPHIKKLYFEVRLPIYLDSAWRFWLGFPFWLKIWRFLRLGFPDKDEQGKITKGCPIKLSFSSKSNAVEDVQTTATTSDQFTTKIVSNELRGET